MKNKKVVTKFFKFLMIGILFLVLVCTITPITAKANELFFDKDGNLCPLDRRILNFAVSGAGSYRAAANGDPTCLDLFHEPKMHAFGGMLTVIVQAGENPGNVTLKVSAKGLKPASLVFSVE